jgi:predicted DCC family thiol-disulfide oxidoreductase YuxK
MNPSGTIVFDGLCVLCSRTVVFILRRDHRGVFMFAAAQSERGSTLLRKRGFDPAQLVTFAVLRGGRVHVRSDAVIIVARELGWPWRALTILRAIPTRWRDAIYHAIATHRYRWFGKQEQCFVPTTEQRPRFLE